MNYEDDNYNRLLDKLGGYLEGINEHPNIWFRILENKSLNNFFNHLSKEINKSTPNDFDVELCEEVGEEINKRLQVYRDQFLEDVTPYYNSKISINFANEDAPQEVLDYLKRYGIITEYTLSALNDDSEIYC